MACHAHGNRGCQPLLNVAGVGCGVVSARILQWVLIPAAALLGVTGGFGMIDGWARHLPPAHFDSPVYILGAVIVAWWMRKVLARPER